MSINKQWAVKAFLFLFWGAGLAVVGVTAFGQQSPPSEKTRHMDPAFFSETDVSGPRMGLSCGRVGCHDDSKVIQVTELGGPFTIDDCGNHQVCTDLLKNGYVPGRTYQMRARISYPGQSSWGFDLWVRDQDGNSAGTLGRQANRTATHTRTQDGIVVGAVGNEGAGYRQNGRYDGPVGWRFSWTAPATNIGPVRFFAEGTACNRDRTRFGDFVYFMNGVVVNPAEGTQ